MIWKAMFTEKKNMGSRIGSKIMFDIEKSVQCAQTRSYTLLSDEEQGFFHYEPHFLIPPVNFHLVSLKETKSHIEPCQTCLWYLLL